ncbi:MAG: hypothetical protein V4642_05210 [Bacteroidota bacterium]
MSSRLQKTNRWLLLFGFIIGNLLWVKTLYDISQYHTVNPRFSFPAIFNILFVAGALLNIALSAYVLKGIWNAETELQPRRDVWTYIFLLAIPLTVLCVSPVCSTGNILIAPYLASTIIRIGLLIVPFIVLFVYLRGKKEAGIFILLASSLLLLFPNDECFNPFNYWWIRKISASPLTYLPVMYAILFVVTGLYGKNKYLITFILFGLCVGSLAISLGHRLRFLW